MMANYAQTDNTKHGNDDDAICELGDTEREQNEGDSMKGKGSEEEERDTVREEVGDLKTLRWHAGRVGAFDVSLYGVDVITDGVQLATHTSN